MPSRPWVAVLSLALAAAVVGPAAAAPAIEPGSRPISVGAEPIPSFAIGDDETTIFDDLEWLGGLELSSRDPDFGSLSGISVAADGAGFVAVTDNGFWVTGRIEQDRAGRPTGVSGVEIAPMLDGAGKVLNVKDSADAEAVEAAHWDGRPVYLVAFERDHRILAYDRAAPGIAERRPSRIALPKAVRRLRANKGIESVAAAPPGSPLDGALVIIAERSQGGSADVPAWLVRGGGRSAAFHIRRRDEFDITDAAFLPDGDLLILERRFNFSTGIFMRIRRISAAELRPGRVADGPVLIEADFTDQIDNMEGLSLHRSAAGDTILTLVSDDNRSILQRTLLLRFRLRQPQLEVTPRLRPSISE